MLFRCRSIIIQVKTILKKCLRKETFSPDYRNDVQFLPPINAYQGRRRAFFFASLRAGLTVEAAVVLPIFFLGMAIVLQMGNVMDTAVRFGSAICETSEEIALAAYVLEYGQASPILRSGLSAAYAQEKVMAKAGDTGAVKNASFLFSAFLEEEDVIDLVMTYQMKPVFGGITIPGVFFLQRGSVRGWTGRSGSGGSAEASSGKTKGQTVYVTDQGSVYHMDANCSHIRLSIQLVETDSVRTLRNSNGEKYHACEKCGKNAGGQVYITEDGNRYHSSLECSGLKRSVHEVSIDDVGSLRACSRCAGMH